MNKKHCYPSSWAHFNGLRVCTLLVEIKLKEICDPDERHPTTAHMGRADR
jgi:hypothetical protein